MKGGWLLPIQKLLTSFLVLVFLFAIAACRASKKNGGAEDASAWSPGSSSTPESFEEPDEEDNTDEDEELTELTFGLSLIGSANNSMPIASAMGQNRMFYDELHNRQSTPLQQLS